MFYDPYATEKNFKALRELDLIAEELNCKLAHLALAWVIKFSHTSSALTGARNPQQLEDNIEALKVLEKLTDKVEERVNKILDTTPAPRTNYLKWQPYPPTRPVAS
jgi:aryl-alcohol dehydrogenase-like predicted oxidoreductase